jgi:hypothetical protein
VLIFFCPTGLKAQSNFQQLTVGIGAGPAMAYAAAPVVKTNAASNGNIAYYITPFFTIALEGQIGKLAGGAVEAGDISFSNSYQALMFESTVQLGIFLNESESSFANAVKGFYLGAGYGYIHNRVNIDINDDNVYTHNTVPMVPVLVGYEFNLINEAGRPRLKVDFSYSYNTTFGKGLDGYKGPISQSNKLYFYYAVKFKYAINLIQSYGRHHIRYD